MEFFATSQGIPVRISDSIQGNQTIVFLHGYLETLDVWEDFMATVPNHFRTVAIDLPGHGLSGTQAEINEVSFSARVVCGVLDLLKIEKAILVGHSMGGYVGQSFLAQFPDRALALVHLNSNPYADAPDKSVDREREIRFIQEGKLQTLAAVSIPNMYAPSNVRKMDDAIQKTVELCDMHDPDGICATLRGLKERSNQVDFLSQVKHPLLFVFGDQDVFLSQERQQQIREQIPNADYALLANTGHNSFLEDPVGTWQSIASFIEKNGL